MKKIYILLFLSVTVGTVSAQNGIERVLESIAQNNKELQAYEQQTRAQIAEAKSENNLSDPSVSYAYTYGSRKELGKSSELSVTQEFDFPTQYGARKGLNDRKSELFSYQQEAFRRSLMLQAKNLCLDLVLLNQERALLQTRLANAESLDELFRKRLATGDANILETNKIRLELMNVRTQADANEVAREAALQQLAGLNGGLPVEFADMDYAPVLPPSDFATLKAEVLSSDADLLALQSQTEVARKQLSVSKGGWLPKLEAGYRRTTGDGAQFNGFIVGGSIPLFENRGKVKAAKAQSLAAQLQETSAQERAETALRAFYTEALQLQTSMQSYDLPLIDESLRLLREALEVRQISLIEYYTEAETLYNSRSQYQSLQNRYQKVMAEIWKGRL